jgi:hypothetical protein
MVLQAAHGVNIKEAWKAMGIDLGVTVLGTVLGGLWATFKASDRYQRMEQRRFRQALLALESGVERTYQAYVKAIKAGRADGRLTEEEKARARSMARMRAIKLAREEGIDLLRTIGEDYIDVWIGRLIGRRKRI